MTLEEQLDDTFWDKNLEDLEGPSKKDNYITSAITYLAAGFWAYVHSTSFAIVACICGFICIFAELRKNDK